MLYFLTVFTNTRLYFTFYHSFWHCLDIFSLSIAWKRNEILTNIVHYLYIFLILFFSHGDFGLRGVWGRLLELMLWAYPDWHSYFICHTYGPIDIHPTSVALNQYALLCKHTRSKCTIYISLFFTDTVFLLKQLRHKKFNFPLTVLHLSVYLVFHMVIVIWPNVFIYKFFFSWANSINMTKHIIRSRLCNKK
jgi:hypothetical protein